LLAALVAAVAGGAAFTAHAASAPGHDGDIWWDGLGHDSRSAIYRLPGGALVPGCTTGPGGCTSVTLRFRTFHNDVTSVTVRTYHTGSGTEKLYDMRRVASDVSCYQQLAFTCDFWEAKIDIPPPLGTIYYRFIVKDGTKTVYYEDDSDVRDGGWGKPFDSSPDWGWAITLYSVDFKEPIPWLQNGIIYQISGSTEASVNGQVKTLNSGEAVFVADGTRAMLRAEGGEPSTFLHFLLTPAASLDQPVEPRLRETERGQEFLALNGGPQFQFTEAISFVVNCETQAEVDHFWDKLSEGGKQVQCGWLKDRFGVSWRVVPRVPVEMLQDKDPEKSRRAMAAMLTMKKIDIAALKRAYEGRTASAA